MFPPLTLDEKTLPFLKDATSSIAPHRDASFSMFCKKKKKVPSMLCKTLASVQTLEEYFDTTLPLKILRSLHIAKYSDYQLFHLLQNTYIQNHTSLSSKVDSSLFSIHHHSTSNDMKEIIHLAIAMLLERSRFQSGNINILCLGYRATKEGQVERHYPNTLVDQFYKAGWERLLYVLGKDLMLHLLLDSIIIVEQERGLFLQICGTLITELVNNKRSTLKIPFTDTVTRQRMLYDNLTVKEYSLGLPYKHPLNKGSSLRRVTLLTEKIFGIKTIPSVGKRFRSSETYQQLMMFVGSLIKRHKKCPYSQLYRYHCSDPSVTVLLTKDSLPANTNKDDSLWKSTLKEYQIIAFCKAIFERLVANKKFEIRRSKAFKALIKKIKMFMYLGRFETVGLETLARGIPLTDLWTVLIKRPRSLKESICPTVERLRANLLKRFIFWIFNDLLVPLLKNNFYITESSIHRNRLFYFRKDTWKRFYDKEMSKVAMGFLERLPEKTDLQNNWQALGLCNLRLIPKSVGFRPIMNLKRQLLRGQITLTSEMLRNIHAILNYHRLEGGGKLGCSIVCMNEAFEKLFQYKKRIITSKKLDGPLHFVKFDIKACYDSIPHEKLFQVIGKCIDKDEYLIRKYNVVIPAMTTNKTSLKRFAFSANDIPLTVNKFKKGLIVDKVLGYKMERKKVLDLVEGHIKRNLVKLGHDYYRQKRGIPQGSILSPLLCSFFYGDLDQNYQSEFLNDPNSLLMRFVDDVLFITPDPDLMNKFINTMVTGFQEYGAFVNMEKTQCTLSHPSLLYPPCREAIFQWCGLNINRLNLCIGADYKKFFGTFIIDSLTIPYDSPVIATFEQYLRIYTRPKLRPLFLNSTLNDDDLQVLSENIYQNAVHVAIKSHVYMKKLKRVTGSVIKSDILLRIIIDLAEYTETKVRELCDNPLIHGTRMAKALTLLAFIELWKKRPIANYQTILKTMESTYKEISIEELIEEKTFMTNILQSGEVLFKNVRF